jgi:hypothetical protein
VEDPAFVRIEDELAGPTAVRDPYRRRPVADRLVDSHDDVWIVRVRDIDGARCTDVRAAIGTEIERAERAALGDDMTGRARWLGRWEREAARQ